jgi:hypothetical protein
LRWSGRQAGSLEALEDLRALGWCVLEKHQPSGGDQCRATTVSPRCSSTTSPEPAVSTGPR